MAKIRGIKPETWSDESFVELTPWARLLFIGLWNFACDNGHLEDRSKQIKMRVFPADDVNCAELLRELESAGRITRQDGYITVPTLTEHQRIDRRYFSACDAPGCVKPDQKSGNPERETRRVHDGDTTGTQRAHVVHTSGPRGDGDGDGEGIRSDGDGELTRAGKPAKRASQLPDTWKPNDKHRALAAERGVDCDLEAIKMRDWAATKGATGKDWDARFRNWLRDARPALTAFKPDPRVANEPVEFPPDGLTDEEMAAWWSRRRA